MSKYEINIGDKVYNVIVNKFTPESAELEINGHPYELEFKGPINTIMDGVASASQAYVPPSMQSFQPPQTPAVPTQAAPKKPGSKKVPEGQTAVVAPIPGSIIEILVKVGDQVKEGQMVIKMEAMKMENEIIAGSTGSVKSIDVNVGDAVSQGDTLLVIE